MAITDVFSISEANFPVRRDLIAGTREFASESGHKLVELVQAPRMRWEISFLGRTWAEVKHLLEFFARMRASQEVFTLDDLELGRKFTVRLVSGLSFEGEMRELEHVSIVLEEAIGEALLEYPTSPLAVLEENHAVLSGSWAPISGSGRIVNGRASDVVRSTAPGNSLSFTYPGYGFRLWAAGAGEIEISLNGEVIFDALPLPATFDAPAVEFYSVPLDVNIVRVRHQAGAVVNIDALEFVYTAP